MGLGATDTAKVTEALTGFRRWAAVLDKRLADRQYVVGNALTIADLTLASSLMYSEKAEVPVSEFPNIAAWFARITALDGWKKTAS